MTLIANLDLPFKEHCSSVLIYLATTAIVLAAAAAGWCMMPLESPDSVMQAIEETMHRWDSEWYLGIATDGYRFRESNKGQNVAFFPSYPMLINVVARVGQLPESWSALVVSQASLLLAFVVFYQYLRIRFPDDPMVQRLSLVAFALVPSGFFWRFAYSESTFLLFALMSMYCMCRRCPLWVTAFFVGLATATRPVGIALLLPYCWHILQHEHRTAARIKLLTQFVPLACWGLLAYMAYQYLEFGEPFAFAKTQQNWRLRPQVATLDKAASYAALEPIWAVYHPHSLWHWNRLEPHAYPLLSLAFWNPIALVGTVGLVAVGWKRRWLLFEEVLLAIGLLSIPYFTRAFDFCMLSQARFASVAFPAYLTIGHLLLRVPRWARYFLFTVSTALLCYFSARFAAGFRLI